MDRQVFQTKKAGLFLFMAVCCISCCEDDDIYVPAIKAYAFYEIANNPGIRKPDVGAKVFFYYRMCTADFDDYTYQGDGLFLKNDSSIRPNLACVADTSGSVAFIPEHTEENATIVIESNYYKGRIGMACFSSTMEAAGYYKIFK